MQFIFILPYSNPFNIFIILREMKVIHLNFFQDINTYKHIKDINIVLILSKQPLNITVYWYMHIYLCIKIDYPP